MNSQKEKERRKGGEEGGKKGGRERGKKGMKVKKKEINITVHVISY